METDTDTTTKGAPPYFAFKTLTNNADTMKEKGIPTRIDRTFLVGMSGTGQTQYINGLKSLGLIDAAGNVQPRFTEFINGSPAERKKILAEILNDVYPQAVELGKSNATTGQLVEVFKEHHGVTGDTARKAIAFYLQAAKYAGSITLSPMFRTPKVTAAAGTTRKKKATTPTRTTNGNGGTIETPTTSGRLHPALAGVLNDLPPYGKGWTVEQRDKFMNAFTTLIEYSIPITDEPYEEEPEEIEEEVDEELEQ